MAFALFGLALVSRLPFGTENFYAHDSVLYARAIERFDPHDHRPQPPGYLWYVLTLRAVDFVVDDPNRAMTLVSAFAGAAAIALLYVLAARLYDERTARVAAIFLFTAVTFWAYGGVAYPYTLLAALTIGCASLFWWALSPGATGRARDGRLIAASVAWGIAIGFRSDLAFFLAPVWLLAAVRATVAGAALSAATIAGAVGGWVVASGYADGGLERFLDAARTQARFVEERYSVFANGLAALGSNAYELARYLGRGLYFLAPLIAVVLVSADARRVELRDRWRTAFMVLWTFAPLPFYLLIHVGEYGYVFSMLPGLAILAARGAIALAKGIRMPRTFRWIVAGVALADAAIFLLSDTPISARNVARHDRGISEKTAYVKTNLRPSSALVVTAYDGMLVDHYLRREYPVFSYDPGAGETFMQPLACRASTPACAGPEVDVVLWDELLRPVGAGWREVRMEHGAKLRIARAVRSGTLRVGIGLSAEIVP